MLISFDTLPKNARIWIFPSSRLLSASEVLKIEEHCSAFLQSWTAHKMDLDAAFKIIDHAFLVISVDEKNTGASGCSLDKLHQFVKELGAELSLSFLERLNVTFLQENGETRILPLKEIEQKIQHAEINASTKVYDITLLSVEELSSKFKVPLSTTWLNRYLMN
ncbi:MAG: hypothetical protein IPJ26_10400 [Bacteroidetes bacterium]|nr:hypothetical protein [Bacteroidota bacterium]